MAVRMTGPDRTTLAARKRYWDETYLAYWRARVAEAGAEGASGVVPGDAKTEDDAIIRAVLAAAPPEPGKALDVGCAWGRMFPLFLELGLEPSGIDISPAMIAEARKEWSGRPKIGALVEADAETLPFPDAAFDDVFCLATFDATYQHLALAEMLRVLRPGGLLYVTGKNMRYEEGDEPAHAAEIGARRQGHPNHFTDVAGMTAQLAAAGHAIQRGYFFAKRGDFAKFAYAETPPARFYEYLLIVRRGHVPGTFRPFADTYSATFRAREAGG